ncbi:Beta-1,4-N-acetylgalactosaminyltransferase bre-4 [Halotydeus destructor]|nr:Beta-1,4-N-acetylgalactosaminyltransferase bre-4 [Halotydeus destructor]
MAKLKSVKRLLFNGVHHLTRILRIEFLLFVLVVYTLRRSILSDNFMWDERYAILQESQVAEDITSCSVVNATLKPLCPNLFGQLAKRFPIRYKVDQRFYGDLAARLDILPGGIHFPRACTPKVKVAIVVPFRDRADQLDVFVQHMHPFLHDQLISYVLVVVEQTPELAFNKGRLMNTGFNEVQKRNPDVCCVIFHDVDLLPENQNNVYSCSGVVRHMSPAVSTMRYKPMYPQLVGGVLAIRSAHFELVNGFSNNYFGWGGEDDDMFERLHANELDVVRWPLDIGRYFMLRHGKPKTVESRRAQINMAPLVGPKDGLSSLRTRVISIRSLPLYTHILVDIEPKNSTDTFDAFQFYEDSSNESTEPSL